MINYDANPNLYETLATFVMARGWISFKYKPLPECKKKVTASVVAARKSTVMPEDRAEWDVVSGFLTDDAIRMTKDGDFIVTLRNMKRKNAGDVVSPETGEVIEESYFSDKSNRQEDGSLKIGFDKGEYLYRSYRLDVRQDDCGVNLASVMVNIGGKKRLFPNVGAVERMEVAVEV